MKKALALLLVLLTVLSLLCSCGDTAAVETEAQTTAVADISEETTADNGLDEKGYVRDDLPDNINYNEEDVTLLYWSDREHEEFYVESENGEVVNDSLFTRNTKVETRLNIKFSYESTPGNASNISNFTNKVQAAYKAGNNDYDLIGVYSITAGNLAVSGLLYDLNTCEAFEWEKPWWPQSLINDATINGKLFFCSGDISANTLYMMYVTFFNKQLLTDFNLEDPYELVDSGKWTLDKMFQMCEGIYSDANANGMTDIGDLYGCYTFTLHLDAFLAGAGITFIDASGDELAINEAFKSDKAVDIVSKLEDFFGKQDRAYLLTENKTVHQYFSAGNSLFWTDRCRNSTIFRDNDVSFGVVPPPKYNEDQTAYYSILGNPFSMYAIPCDTRQPEMMATVLECYASESYRTVSPALYEITMKYRYTDDSTSGRMFDITRDGRVFDLGRIFAQNLNSPYSAFESCVANGNSWSSVISANAKKLWPNALKQVLKSFN